MIPSQDPLIGAKLGSYEIIEAIGEGGMARIYKGFHAELNRYAAIKVVHWGLQEDPEFTERFRREAQAIAILRHPNIVQIFDFGKHTSGYFMVMEFIEGSDLAVQLQECKQKQILLSKEKVNRIAREVGAALDYAHSRNVVHRDIKPSNIMITPEGQSILTDFGLVMLPARRSQATIGSTFGTPHYVAPEQAISSAAAVPASDIYSLGIILYEMVTGQLPFDDESPLSVALKHISDLPTPPRALNPDIPVHVEDVILRALAKDPADRFTTAGDMASALEAGWAQPVTSKKSERRGTAPLLPAGVPSAAAVRKITLPNAAAIAPVTTSAEMPQEEKEPSSTHRKRVLLPIWWPLVLAGIIGALIGYFALASFFSSPANSTSPSPSAISQVASPTRSDTPTIGATPSNIPTQTPLVVPPAPTATPTDTPASTATPTFTPTPPPTPPDTPTPEPTPTSTATPTATATLTPTPPLPTFTLTPAPTPTGPLSREELRGKILFKTDRAGFVEIYRMDADGSNQRPLGDTSVYLEVQAQLPFSPNKQEQIVIRGEGQLDLWRYNLITNQELRVTSTAKPEYDAAWSPVDNRIAYVSEETGNGDIYTLNLDGSAVERLTINIDSFDKHPTWSPDGTKIAFWSDMSFNKTRQIWVIDLATKTLTSLSDNPYNDWDPVWVH